MSKRSREKLDPEEISPGRRALLGHKLPRLDGYPENQETKTMHRVAVLFITALVLVPLGSRAQFVQYSPAGDFRGPAETREEAFTREMENARWRFGRLHVNPWLAIRDLTYVKTTSTDESGANEADVSATLGAGLDAYLPVGSGFVVGGYARPGYVWWRDNTDRNRVTGRAGLGLFGNFGRIGLEGAAERSESSQIFSREFEERVNQRWDEIAFELTIDLGKRTAWFARAESRNFESIEDDPLLGSDFDRLDRSETTLQTGFGVFVRDQFRLGLGVEDTEVDFDITGTFDRSNTGTGTFIELDYSGDRFSARGNLTDRTVEPTAPGSLATFDGQTGSLDVSLRPVGPVQLELSYRNNLSFSLATTSAFFESTISTAAVRVALGSRASLRGFYEAGELDFSDPSNRLDDLTGGGVTLAFKLGRAQFTISASETEYDSNLPNFDRTVTRLRTGVNFGLFDSDTGGPWG